MGQRNRQGDWREDDREGRYGNRFSQSSGQRSSEQGWGSRDREQDARRTGQTGDESSRGSSGGYSSSEGYGREGRGGESMRRNVEDGWRGQGGGSSARDYDYGYGRSGVSDRDYEGEHGQRGNEYYGGGGLFGGGMGGYTGGGYRGGGLGSNFDTSSSSTNYSDYPRTDERQGGRGREGDGWWNKMTNEVSSWFGGEGDENRSRESRRGKGPKGYTRSDDRIREDVNERLTEHYAIDASDIEIEVNAGEITLTGTVDSRYEKRLAEDVVEAVSGVNHVENRLRVSQNGSYGSSMGSSGTSMGSSGASTSLTSSDTSDTSSSNESGRSAGAR
ncbi:MAG: BON domain-containing protein [bacterium]|nr:BON domain-containing protein [bacterium]